MGAAVGDIQDTDIRDQYFGRTSIVSLVQECSRQSPRGLQTRAAKSDTPSFNTPASCNISCATGQSSLVSDDYSLPPRKTADWLLDVYFNSPHLFYPWVHKDTFLITYGYIWEAQDNRTFHDLPDVGVGGRDCPTAVFYCALNAMLALGCEFSNLPSHTKRSTSLMLSERMKALISIDIFDSGSLAHVQALLLVATYLQCTSYPKRCWNIVGMAYRMSIGLGLHLSRHARGLTALERELRWRAWCACVHLDILVSMTMGRPAMTSPDNVPLPSPSADRYLADADTTPPPGEVSVNQYLYENMRLIKILSNILSKIYHSAELSAEYETRQNPEVDLQAVVGIDRAFDDFEASLDPALKWTSPPASTAGLNPVFKRQSNVLHARFLHLRMLLYRPVFTEYCSFASESGGGSTLGGGRWSGFCRATCASGCVQAACGLICSLFRATKEDATGAWWYGVFYLISAGIILLLADSSGLAFDAVDPEDRENAWAKCIETLHRMADVHPSARDYAIALAGLKQNQKETISADDRDSNRIPWSDQHEGMLHGGPILADGVNISYSILDPLLSNWDHGIEDIMLPAQLLQDLDEGLSLPSLF
ncbi:fungal specific transcription factor domain-containing protein [Aspergillus lucknowensis]|uniref:Fungal-specific transcription factor domain-containing protein n=1 Tax=Aspergillus lucknowensis TaxID=176173 RepID=A0ABR4M3Q5_9EURO